MGIGRKKAPWVVFDGNDSHYLAWLTDHSSGFVLNTTRTLDPAVMVLHTARCPYISALQDQAGEGGFTERDYIKVCADTVSALREWTKQNGRRDGSFSSEACSCRPVR